MNFISFGEVLFDCLPSGSVLGGAPLNFAYHLIKLDNNGFIYTAVGNDKLGNRAKKEIQNKGLNLDLVHSVDYPTGRADITLINGNADYTFNNPSAWDNIPYSLGDKQIESIDLLYFGTLSQRSIVSRNTLKKIFSHYEAKEIFFDVNLRKSFYTPEIINDGINRATILKLNEEELPVVLNLVNKQSIEELSKDYNLKIVIVTLGSNGSKVYSNGIWKEQHIKEGIAVIDTVGAGDSFSAGFISTFFKTGDIDKSLKVATEISGYFVGHKGAMPTYTTKLLDTINNLMQ